MMNRKLILLIAGFCFISLAAHAQDMKFCDSSKTNTRPGTVSIISSPQVKAALAPALQKVEEPDLKGFRVQVYSGTDRAAAEKIKNQLQTMYPKYPVYFFYDSPYFKTRIGDFRNKPEAQQLLHDLKERFEGVLLVPDSIKFPELD